MTRCAVKGCHNSSCKNNKEKKITFHLFPSDPIAAARWTHNIRLNRKEECWKPTKTTKICSEHFNDEEIYATKGGYCKLSQDAVPTKGLHLFCNDESRNKKNGDLYNTQDLDKKQLGSSNEVNENNPTKNSYEAQTQTYSTNISQDYDAELDSIFDSPRMFALRTQLAKKIVLQRKHCNKIRSLQQKVRHLKKKNKSLQNILKKLAKEKVY